MFYTCQLQNIHKGLFGLLASTPAGSQSNYEMLHVWSRDGLSRPVLLKFFSSNEYLVADV